MRALNSRVDRHPWVFNLKEIKFLIFFFFFFLKKKINHLFVFFVY
jgi:hypothetical protein